MSKLHYVLVVNEDVVFVIRQEENKPSQSINWCLQWFDKDYATGRPIYIHVKQEPNCQMGITIPSAEFDDLYKDMKWLLDYFGPHHIFVQPGVRKTFGVTNDTSDPDGVEDSWKLKKKNHPEFAGHEFIGKLFSLMDRHDINRVKGYPVENVILEKRSR